MGQNASRVGRALVPRYRFRREPAFPPAVSAVPAVTPDLDTLIGLFHQGREELGDFAEVEATELPAVYRKLLAHEHHMTVTVEAHYGCPVDVRVLDRRITSSHYAREILLTRQTDGVVVQYGIMRVNLAYLDAAVRAEIERESVPLGRILIDHNVLRSISLFSLWRIAPAPHLCEALELDWPRVIYGRTAMIYCDHEPAIELLEIVK
jgi:chorismate-pyruvate lyase